VDAIEVEPNFFFQSYNSGPLTRQSGEPLHAGVANQSRSLWFKFTATAETAGPVVFSTMGSQDTVAAVYTGSALNALTEVTSNNDFSGRLQAEVSWNAVAGTTYYIAVASAFTGGVSYPHVCTFQRITNNDFASGTVLTGDSISVTSHNLAASKQSGEPNHAGNSGGRSVWFSWTPATSGTFRVSTIGSNMRIFDVGPVFKEMDTLLGTYTGSAVDGLTSVASNNDYGFPDRGTYNRRGINSELFFQATAGTTYRIAVDGFNGSGMSGGDWGQIRLDITKQDRPANDAFANAEVIPSGQLPFLRTTDLTNRGASTEAGEPTHAGNATKSQNTLWFRFTAPETRTYYASTAGNLYDDYRARNTVVAVYTGSAINALTPIASNDNGLGLGHSIASFNATAGTTYHIAIASQHPGGMSFMLVPAPANDDFANATQVWGSKFTAVGYNVGASGETNEFVPYTARTGTLRSVWWKWTAPVTGTYSVDTYNSDLWVELSIHSAAGGPSALPIWTQSGVVSDPLNYTVNGKRDSLDRRARGTMTTSYLFTAGTTYYFRVTGGGSTGDHAGTIRLEVSGPPAIPPAPLGLTGTRSGQNVVILSWQDLSEDETSYVLERSLDGSAWSALATLPANTVNYLDASAPAADLHYRLRATNALGASAWASTFVTLPAPPAAPSNFSGTGTSMTSTSLTWDAVAGATSLRLERSATGNLGPWTLVSAAIPGNATTFSDTGLLGNKTYWYRLRATNAIGNGPWSAVAAVTTLNAATLVSDSFNDGGATDGADPLDVAWSTVTVPHTVVTDSVLDSGTPGNVLETSTTTTEGDVYAYFTLPGGNQTLAVGESLKLSFKLRHTGTPRADNSRTGFSIAYTPNNSPWATTGNREYMVRTSYGSTSNWTSIARTADVQLVNSHTTNVELLGNQPGINAGTSATSAWLEVQRTGESTVVLRAQIGSNPIIETTDTGTSNGANSGIITTFNRVFFRFRTVAGTTDPKFRLDDVVVTKTLAGTPAPSKHPITAWRDYYFGTQENSGLAADAADADGDGLSNLFEYAFNSNPLQADGTPQGLPQVDIASVGGLQHLTLSFTPEVTAGLRFIVEASTDLVVWTGTDVSSLLNEGMPYTFTDSEPLAPPNLRRFLRLRIEIE
jgi:hypothetical protein